MFVPSEISRLNCPQSAGNTLQFVPGEISSVVLRFLADSVVCLGIFRAPKRVRMFAKVSWAAFISVALKFKWAQDYSSRVRETVGIKSPRLKLSGN